MTKTRIIDVPISYTVKLVPPKKRNAREFDIIENVPVEIPDLSADEAPVAMRLAPLSSHWYGKKPVDHRWFGERLYAPFGRAASGKDLEYMQVEDMVAKMADRNEDPYHVPFSLPARRYNLEYIERKDLPPGRIEDDGTAERAQKIATVQAQAAEMVLVDGGVYLTCAEPIYQLEYNSSGFSRSSVDEPTFSLRTIAPSEIKVTTPPDHFFRVDQLNEALSVMRAADDRRGLSPADLEENVWNRVEVLIPDAVRFIFDVRPRMDMAIEHLLEKCRKRLPDSELPFMKTYVGLRALVAESPRDYDKVASFLADELVPAMEAERIEEWNLERARTAVTEWVSRKEPASLPAECLEQIAGMRKAS